MTEVKQALSRQFEVKDMGALHYFLGVKFIQDQTTGNVWMGQQSYTEKRYDMQDCKTICGHEYKVAKDLCRVSVRSLITCLLPPDRILSVMWLSFVQSQQSNIGLANP